ncbi:nitrate/sulfonate/bicarbonate ABC transporter ATP-binding protein [Telmatospirillum siberiense]|uniref:Nitrate/sulfonate/bicarbonate ABC transporter ATP-binding protein n=2 Tax=Telmatospirillum siberiense TaxID=382514 RepID=A0A2N3PVF6_9PROT|nr:nitrate/sulfonate/bicarbonate ABC transporter ATP-binding protein [Telmatospirillum siberiense]
MAPALAVSGIAKHFGQQTILGGIDLEVRPGEIVALIGPSGCGKSTLLNILSGLLPPDAGHISIGGARTTGFDDWRRVAYMFQEDRLLPWRTVRDNVSFGLEGSAVPRGERRRRTADALRLVGLDGVATAWPHELSGGMRSRAALARSLVVQPAVLLMDEPFSRLDPQTRSQMHDEVLRIQADSGMTVIFVTHDMEEAVVLADRIIRLAPHPGRIVEALEMEDLPRPRIPTEPEVAERIRQLRVRT